MKVSSRSYKGIEYIQLNDLPKDQQEKIKEALNEDAYIKLLIDKSIISNCIQYKDYERWFDCVYTVHAVTVRVERSLEVPDLKMIFGKA